VSTYAAEDASLIATF